MPIKSNLFYSSEKNFKLIVEAIPNPIIIVDKSGRIVFVNSHTENLFEFTFEELEGKYLELIIPDRYKDRHPGFRENFMEKPITRFMGVGRDLYAKSKAGREIPVEVGLNPIETENDIFILAIIIDNSYRKEFEKVKELYISEVEKKNKRLEQFNYIVSHDLKEPLRTIRNY